MVSVTEKQVRKAEIKYGQHKSKNVTAFRKLSFGGSIYVQSDLRGAGSGL